MDKHPHGNCKPCRQQEIKELIGRVNLHVRVGDELLICLDECKVLSQRWQVGSHEKKPAKLPFLGTFLFNTSCKQTAHSLCPRRARLLCRIRGAGCAARVPADDSTAALRRGRARLQRGRAHACYGFSFWSGSLAPSRSHRCVADPRSGQPALGSQNEGQRDVMTLKSCCWGKWYQPCTQPAELDRSVWTLNPLRHFSHPPRHCRLRICWISQCFSLSAFTLRSGQQNILYYLSNLLRLMHWSHQIKM